MVFQNQELQIHVLLTHSEYFYLVVGTRSCNYLFSTEEPFDPCYCYKHYGYRNASHFTRILPIEGLVIRVFL